MNTVTERGSPGTPSDAGWVGVRDGRFVLDGRPYYFTGVNFWYGAYLGSPGPTGDRERLVRELDQLLGLGVTNLRVLAASEESALKMSVRPAIQTAPGVYDETLLQGLDFLLDQMARRGMKAVLYLNNYWQWSGGMNQYVSWVTGRPVVDPDVSGDWPRFIATSAEFYRLPEAQDLYRRYLRHIIERRNTVNGRLYRDDPTIMAWQLANEPRPGVHGQDPALNDVFVQWVAETAAYIKRLDPKHLVSTGSEGSWGSLDDMDLYKRAHRDPNVDYLTVHLWIKNWSWFDAKNPEATYPTAVANAERYLREHVQAARELGKPLVLEEFGVERDGGDYRIESSTHYRDRFLTTVYAWVLEDARGGGPFMGSNLWTWGGAGRARHPDLVWRPGDPFTGDPPQEPQGLNSVFDIDRGTLAVIRAHAREMNRLGRAAGP